MRRAWASQPRRCKLFLLTTLSITLALTLAITPFGSPDEFEALAGIAVIVALVAAISPFLALVGTVRRYSL